MIEIAVKAKYFFGAARFCLIGKNNYKAKMYPSDK
jgi:hypothetical protein